MLYKLYIKGDTVFYKKKSNKLLCTLYGILKPHKYPSSYVLFFIIIYNWDRVYVA